MVEIIYRVNGEKTFKEVFTDQTTIQEQNLKCFIDAVELLGKTLEKAQLKNNIISQNVLAMCRNEGTYTYLTVTLNNKRIFSWSTKSYDSLWSCVDQINNYTYLIKLITERGTI